MLYRQKILLALIDAFGGTIDKLRLQKMLFLLSQRREKPVYEFVPFHYGPYSFTAQWDINALLKKEFLREDDQSLTLVRGQKHPEGLRRKDFQYIHQLWQKYRDKKTDELLRELYEKYPYYAVRSKILDKVLDKEAKQRVEQQRNRERSAVLFTIGYEGRSIENYFNALVRNGVGVLVDVRSNPVSRKPGFSRRQLENYCNSFEMGYKHFPEVGVVAELRMRLSFQKDYDKLFSIYRRHILPATVSTQYEILKILQHHQRIALTCFEAESNRCHRSYLARAISNLPGFCYQVKHL
jgi:uncharacterized protein (DUF488 family)